MFQLPQLDASGQDPGGRRFRIENGDSLGEKEEVIIFILIGHTQGAVWYTRAFCIRLFYQSKNYSV